MLYKFIGFYPVFYNSGLPTPSGSGMVNPGEVVELAEIPNAMLWVPEDDMPPATPDSPATPPPTVSEPPVAIPEPDPSPVVPADEPDLFRH